MTEVTLHPLLTRALALSQELMAAAEKEELEILGRLDAERLLLLKSFRLEAKRVHPQDQAMLEQISQLNDRTIGLLQHQQRGKGREMDMAAVGRRAVVAYYNHRS